MGSFVCFLLAQKSEKRRDVEIPDFSARYNVFRYRTVSAWTGSFEGPRL